MGRHAKDSGESFQQAPVGNHVGRCFRIVDIGTQHGEYQGQPNVRNQILVFWELPNEMMETDEGAKPFIVSKFYTNSLNEKATLRHDLEAWRGKAFAEEELSGFDLMNILGKPCMVSIIKAESGKSKVGSIAAMPKGIACPPAVNPSDAFWLDEWDAAKFEKLSDGLKKLVMKSDEYIAMTSEKPKHEAPAKKNSFADMDDDIPF